MNKSRWKLNLNCTLFLLNVSPSSSPCSSIFQLNPWFNRHCIHSPTYLAFSLLLLSLSRFSFLVIIRADEMNEKDVGIVNGKLNIHFNESQDDDFRKFTSSDYFFISFIQLLFLSNISCHSQIEINLNFNHWKYEGTREKRWSFTAF